MREAEEVGGVSQGGSRDSSVFMRKHGNSRSRSRAVMTPRGVSLALRAFHPCNGFNSDLLLLN